MIKFQKLQGTGNDFIIFNDTDVKNINHSELAKKVCNRNFGIGADGMMIVEKSSEADIKMSFYNADGSIATMCGNGIRCFAKFAYENNLVKNTKFNVETLAGIMKLEVETEKDKVEAVRVNFGKPQFFANEVPRTIDNECYLNREIKICGQKLKISSLIMGTIHTVVFVDDFDNAFGNINDGNSHTSIEEIGKSIENNKLFPMKTNVNFCKILDKKNIEVLTWEKGVGMTLSCGTGAAASFVVSSIVHDCDKKVNVKVKGGKLVIEDIAGEIFMTGPAKLICEGSYNMQT